MVYGANGPIESATVTLSAGAATNGVFRSTATDHEGRFSMNFNFQPLGSQANNAQLLAALSETVMRASKPGYESNAITLDLSEGSQSGQNIGLTAATSNNQNQVVWSDDFNSSQNFWTAEGGYTSSTDGVTGWNRLASGHTISNELVGDAVKLGQGDTSEGRVPQPIAGNNAWWFGNTLTGNFIGERDYEYFMDGGESVSPVSGTLTSGDITLPSSGPISLTFQTWWEIESVNPNQNGFDWLDIQVSIAGENDFTTLARLNPQADPVSSLDRDPLPYTTGGFNQAPIWVQQEPISLEDYLGKTIQVRFRFDTNDELYNGFRGWLLDDLQILRVEGTHPPFVGYDAENWCEFLSENMEEDEDLQEWYEEDCATASAASVQPTNRAVFMLNPQR